MFLLGRALDGLGSLSMAQITCQDGELTLINMYGTVFPGMIDADHLFDQILGGTARQNVIQIWLYGAHVSALGIRFADFAVNTGSVLKMASAIDARKLYPAMEIPKRDHGTLSQAGAVVSCCRLCKSSLAEPIFLLPDKLHDAGPAHHCHSMPA